MDMLKIKCISNISMLCDFAHIRGAELSGHSYPIDTKRITMIYHERPTVSKNGKTVRPTH